MAEVSDNERSFGELHFSNAQLGDRRRTKRLVELTNKFCRHPGGSLPQKLKSPKDLKALYRLCNCDDVTHQAVLDSLREHSLAVLQEHGGTVLLLHDGTELDFTTHKSLADELGQIGKGRGRGYICHNTLAVDPASREALGLVNQILHRRADVPEEETLTESRERESRESLLWLRGTAHLPSDRRLVDVCDQGADTFEFLEHEFRSGRRFVIRSKYARKMFPGHELTESRATDLRSYARGLPACGGKIVEVQGQAGKNPHKARRAKLLVSAAPVRVARPHARHGHHGNTPLPLWIVRVWEPHPPRGEKLEWFLLTNEPVATLEDACRVISWYETRWVIEEFHKAMKTGMEIEGLQFTDTQRLEPMIGVLSAVATTLLNLRAASRRPDAKRRRATTLFCAEYVEILSVWRYDRVRRDLTIHEFFYALARLGGHQNRKSDKQPGWIVLWRGWTTLQAMLTGAELHFPRT